MTTPDLPPLPRVTRSMVFKHFGPNAGRDLLRTEWKDGIDLEVATYALQCFAEDYAAAAVLAEQEKAEAMRTKAQELVDALDGSYWSSWQTTAGFSAQWEALRASIRAEPKEKT